MERICKGCGRPVGDEPWFQAKDYWHVACEYKTIAFSGSLRAAEQTKAQINPLELEPK